MTENNLAVSINKQSGNGSFTDQRIIVIGASAGGFEAFKKIIHGLPADFTASIFIVWHMSPAIRGVLPQVLNRENSIDAAHAFNNEEIKPNRIYVAPPDHHMLIEDGKVLITHGPKENRFLLTHLGDHYAGAKQPMLASLYFKKQKKQKSGQNWYAKQRCRMSS
jgi:chemotaxis response regulator CheB